MSYATLNDATITIPSADLRSIVLSAVGIAQDNITTALPSSSTGVSLSGISFTNWLIFGGIAFIVFNRKKRK